MGSGDPSSNTSCYRRDYVTRLVIDELYPEQCHDYVKVMFGQVFPAMAVIVTVTNLTVVAVFLKPQVRSYTSFILTLIALSDVLNILCPSLVYAYFYTLGNYRDPVPYHLCRWTYYFADILKDMFNCFSLWLTVLLAYIRARCISSPLTACNFHTKRNILLSIFVIVLLAMIVFVPSMFIFEFIPVSVTSDTGIVTYTCQVTTSDIFGKCVFRKLLLWLETVLTSFIPCVLLIGLNLKMLWSLRMASKDRDWLLLYEPVHYEKTRSSKTNTTRHKCNSSQQLKRDLEVEFNETGVQSDQGARLSRNPKYFVLNLLHTLAVKWQGNDHTGVTKTDSIRSRDSVYTRLNRESRRTSWYIVLVVTIIASHEIPMAAIIAHTLMTHEGRLPIVIYGCSTMLLHLWQYATYTLIFLLYCCMCSAFRSELGKTLSCSRGGAHASPSALHRNNVFTSPCSVRKHLTKSKEDGSQGKPFVAAADREDFADASDHDDVEAPSTAY